MTDVYTTAQFFRDAIKGKQGQQPYDTQATVTRVDGNTLYVHIPGGVEETPVKRTINASEGDTIQIRVGGGSAWAVGNASAPPTDDTQAYIAGTKAAAAQNTADKAIEELRIQRADIDHLMASQIETYLIKSPDYAEVVIPLIYPEITLFPGPRLYPSDGTVVTKGFAIDLLNGVIRGAFYSEQIARLEERVAKLENSLVYPKEVPTVLAAMRARQAIIMEEQNDEEETK